MSILVPPRNALDSPFKKLQMWNVALKRFTAHT